MSKVRVSRFVFPHRAANFSRRSVPFLLVPVAILAIVAFSGFRHSAMVPAPLGSNPLVLPAGWPMPPIPADNQITQEKFVLGRQLFYEKALSGDQNTSCATCHDQYHSFASSAGGPHTGAFGDTARPFRNVPRLINLAYDTVLMWDGHFLTLEAQVRGPLSKRGELNLDTTVAISRLANNPAYVALFKQAFGDGTITFDRVAKAIATFERCLISGNSPYDQYLNGETSMMSASAIRGMNLFFDTMKTNCSDCHNNMGSGNRNTFGQTFSDNNYYRTGTFESFEPGGGYGFDTTKDTNEFLDAGRAGITRDTNDVGKFRTPTLRNAILTPPFGADGTITSLSQLLENYNLGGSGRSLFDTNAPPIFNKDPRIKPLNLDSGQLVDLTAFLNSLGDLSFISNPEFNDPGVAAVHDGDRSVSGNLSVYPNPASSGFVNVESPDLTGLTEARLISENGAMVWQQAATANGRMHLDFTGVPNGIYRLELHTNSAVETANIVLQR